MDLNANGKPGNKDDNEYCSARKHEEPEGRLRRARSGIGMKMLSLTNKKIGPFFGNRAMLLTDNHQAWRLSKRHDDPWN
jgi:hypothetical protein